MQIFFFVTVVLLAAYAFLIIAYFRKWKKIPDEHYSLTPNNFIRVTVIIPARNEEENIAACLQSLIAQNYPSNYLQIIVVNDHSTDNTGSIVKGFSGENILLLDLADHPGAANINSYKKKAIELAIGRASGELIVCTDADCIATPRWIASMVACYKKNSSVFIAAPVRMEAPQTLLGIFQALDFLPLQGITAAAVFHKLHAMSNGANLCYTKEAFKRVNGFEGIDEIASGDDMLLMQKMARAYPGKINYLKSSDAIVTTRPEKTVRAFIHQRVRWASKAGKYKGFSINAVLLLVYLLNVALGGFMIMAFIHSSWLLAMVALLAIKTLTEFFFVRSVARFFGQAGLMIYFPFLQALHIFYTIVAGALGLFTNYQWKDRRVR